MLSSPCVALLLAAGLVSAEATPAVGPEAVWKPPADFRANVTAACASPGSNFAACFGGQMREAGASDAALAFAERTGNQGYLTAFVDAGKVDIAYAEYPFRANENALVFLVNGEPPLLDVDDLSRIDRKSIEANPSYAGLLGKYPQLALFPAERRAGREPRASKLRIGGQVFGVVYELHDGCHACEKIGYVRIGFEFDVEGRFVGTEVVQVRPRHE